MAAEVIFEAQIEKVGTDNPVLQGRVFILQVLHGIPVDFHKVQLPTLQFKQVTGKNSHARPDFENMPVAF